MVRAGRPSILSIAVSVGIAASAGVVAAGENEPEAVLERLRAGNDRFVRALQRGDATSARRAVVDTPSAAIVSCADAAWPPEQLFDTAPGDIYSVRVAGPIADRIVIASVEDAVERLDVSVLIVLGHETCATVRRAAKADASRPRGADPLADALAPAMVRATGGAADLDARLAPIQATVELTVNELLRASEPLRRHVRSKALFVAGAYYESETGRVVLSRRVDRVPAAAHVNGTR